MKKYKCMNCLTSFKADYKDSCPSCGDPFDVMELPSTTDKLSVDKLQEQLNTAKKALEYIINSNDTAFGFVNSNLRRYVEDALAAIGGDDD